MIYRDDLFSRGTMERFVGHFIELLGRVVTSPEQPAFGLPLLPEAELAALKTWSGAGSGAPENCTVVDLFKEQAQRRPEAAAVLWDSQSLTYRELEERSRRVAARLLQLGLPREGVVGLCLSSATAAPAVRWSAC